jgi:SAM-dependent methyltransferase
LIVPNPDSHPYDRHVGRYGQALAAGLIELAEVGSRERVLDVGCGTGQLTLALAEAVGAVNVSAIDASEEVVQVARARIPGADISVASAQALPFADGTFDAVLAQLVVNLVDDPPGAVREMARVTRPRGIVAACFWDDEEMPLLRSMWDAAGAVAPGALSEVNPQAQVGLADVEVLSEWWVGAGLVDVVLGDLEVAAQYESFDDLWAPFAAGVGHSGKLYLSLDPEQQKAVQVDAQRRLGSPTGAFRLVAKARTVRGTAV